MSNYLNDKEVAEKLGKISEQLDSILGDFDRLHFKAGFQDAISEVGDALEAAKSQVERTKEVYEEAAEEEAAK